MATAASGSPTTAFAIMPRARRLTAIYYAKVDGSAIRRSCSRSSPRTASACRPTTTGCTTPRRTPGVCSGAAIEHAGVLDEARAARPEPRAVRVAGHAVPRLARRRRGGQRVCGDDLQRRHHGHLGRRHLGRPRPDRRHASPPTSASAARTCARRTSRCRAAAVWCRCPGAAKGCGWRISNGPGHRPTSVLSASDDATGNLKQTVRGVGPLGSLDRCVAALLRRDARLSQEPGRFRQADRHVARRRDAGDRRPGSSRPGRRQHLRVHRRCAAREHRHDPRPRRTTPRRARGSSSPAAWPNGTATSWRRRCPRSTRSPGSACRSRLGRKPSPTQSVPVLAAAIARPAQPSPTAGECAVGVRQDRRRMRSHVRVLRDPEFPRSAAQPRRGVDPGRSRPARRPRDRARRPGPRVLRQGPARRARRRLDRAPRSAVAERIDWVRLLYLYPSDLTDGLIDAILDSGVPYFDLSFQHVSKPLLRRMRRWGDGDRFLQPHRRHPRRAARRRVPQELHRRIPG